MPETTQRCDHKLTSCNDCEGNGCSYCNGRGYYEICRRCKEPMGSTRKKWKRSGRPTPWVGFEKDLPPASPRRMQCKDLPTLEILFALWAWHHESQRINAETNPDPMQPKYISISAKVRKYPPDVVKVMTHLYGVPEKLVYAKLDKLEDKDLIDYGGTIRLAWPTEKGLALLREAGLVGPA